MRRPSKEQIIETILNNNFALFTQPYSVNLGGVRTEDNESNTFNDWLYAFCYLPDGGLNFVVIPATTDPGLYYRINPMNRKGTAIIKHDEQYRGVYQLQDPKVNPEFRGHKGKKAFRQIKPMTYWRDNNRDKYLDFEGELHTEIAHTNIHYMGTLGHNVNKWSAGCPGSTEDNMNLLYGVADLQIKHGLGDKFSFSLFSEKSIKK